MSDYESCECELCKPGPDAIEMMKQQMTLAVKRGAYLLDEQFPGWQQKINTDCLDLSSGYSCVLGQLFRGFHNGLSTLGLDREPYQASEHGFDYPQDVDEGMNNAVVWRALTELWLDLI